MFHSIPLSRVPLRDMLLDFFGINIYHSSAGRNCAGIVTMAYPVFIKINGANYPKFVGYNAQFVCIAEMAIYILQFHFIVSRGGRRHRGISCLVRGIRIIEVMRLCIGFKLFDDTVGVFRVVFSNIRFNVGSVKQNH